MRSFVATTFACSSVQAHRAQALLNIFVGDVTWFLHHMLDLLNDKYALCLGFQTSHEVS